MNARMVLFAAFVGLLPASYSNAAVRVAINTVLQATTYSSGQQIDLTGIDDSVTMINVYAETPADTDIGAVTLVEWVARPADFNLDMTADDQDLTMLLNAVSGTTPP